MSEEQPQPAGQLAIALERIAAEKVARTGRLDLSELGLKRLPAGLAGLDWLVALDLSGRRGYKPEPISDL